MADYGTSLETIEQLSGEKERLRLALKGILRALQLRTPRAYPNLTSWASAMQNSDDPKVRSEARATLEAYRALITTTEEGDVDERSDIDAIFGSPA